MNPPTAASRRRRYPLHVYIASLFTVLVLITGLLIAGVDYANARRLALDAVAGIFERSARETLAELRAGHDPVRALVTQLAQQPGIAEDGVLGRLAGLPLLGRALDSTPLLSTLYFGFADGGLLSIRRLDHAAARRSERAPEGAAYRVRLTPPGRGGDSIRFYDAEMRPVAERAAARSDPRALPWFEAARMRAGPVRTPAHGLSSGEIGFAVAEATPDGRAVVGGELALKDVSASLSRQRASPSAQLALVDGVGRALAASHGAWERVGDGPPSLPTLQSLDLPVLAQTFSSARGSDGVRTQHHEGRAWETFAVSYTIADGEPLYLVMAAPHDELLAGARMLRWHALLSMLAVLLVAVPLTWWIARRVSLSLRELSAEARAIRRFSFEGRAVDSFVLEVDDLGQAMAAMRSTIREFLDIASKLSAERVFQRLLDRLIADTVAAARADAGAVYLCDDGAAELRPAAWRNVDLSLLREEPSAIRAGDGDSGNPLRDAWRRGKMLSGRLGALLPEGLEWVGSRFPGQHVAWLSVPLSSREGKTMGVLFLVRSAAESGFSREQAAFVDALSGTLAVAVDNQRLMLGQKTLLEAVIRLMAGAIDAKSPYTGGHCQRVPELALMLAEAACEARSGPFRDFRLSDDEWETLSIAAWLHDCGKVTTPEYVVDKATKLETLYDRIHEVRMRFEVLKRDAEIAYWKAVAEGGDPTGLAAARDAQLAALDEDFAFVAECNIGGERLTDGARARLEGIAGRTWRRTLDGRLGVSRSERQRKAVQPERPLPVDEPLLADRPDHRLPQQAGQEIPADLRMEAPRHRLDLGELHCLSVDHGTLTDEERFIINHHIVQTMIMLRALPFPEHLKGVPDLAGSHHEHLDGSGYPRGLAAAALTPQARILAIADVFEALTAADRPYKPGRRLSEAVGLLADRVRMGHLDRDLFELFLRDGVHLRFARRYLDPARIDEVDVAAALAAAAPPAMTAAGWRPPAARG